ncbi:hypothetical protein CYK37_30145 [Mesorhizobium loti]|nr:hypothetical protein CYK37_30145 [Mesorhizobium loti]
MNIAAIVGDTISERATSVVAAASVTSPAWLPSLDTVSVFAAKWTPILGASWLIVQIAVKIWEAAHKDHDK